MKTSLYDHDFCAWANEQAVLLRGNSWRLSIENTRYRLDDHLNDNPSLNAQHARAMRDAYRLTLVETERGTGLARNTFPSDCPYTFDQAMSPDCWPE